MLFLLLLLSLHRQLVNFCRPHRRRCLTKRRVERRPERRRMIRCFRRLVLVDAIVGVVSVAFDVVVAINFVASGSRVGLKRFFI